MKSTSPALAANVQNFDALPDTAFVRLPTVCGMFGIAPATAWRWAKSGRLPTPRKLGERVSGWNVGELRRALAPSKGAS